MGAADVSVGSMIVNRRLSPVPEPVKTLNVYELPYFSYASSSEGQCASGNSSVAWTFGFRYRLMKRLSAPTVTYCPPKLLVAFAALPVQK